MGKHLVLTVTMEARCCYFKIILLNLSKIITSPKDIFRELTDIYPSACKVHTKDFSREIKRNKIWWRRFLRKEKSAASEFKLRYTEERWRL